MRGCFLDAGSMGDALDWTALTDTLDDWTWHHNTEPAEVGERLRGVDVAVTNKVVLDAGTIAAADALKLICVAATGVNNVDLQAAADHGIPVLNVSGYGTPAVSQHVLALMLGHATRWAAYDAAVKRGAWARANSSASSTIPSRNSTARRSASSATANSAPWPGWPKPSA